MDVYKNQNYFLDKSKYPIQSNGENKYPYRLIGISSNGMTFIDTSGMAAGDSNSFESTKLNRKKPKLNSSLRNPKKINRKKPKLNSSLQHPKKISKISNNDRYSNTNLIHRKSNDIHSLVSNADSDIFYFDFTGNREIVEVETVGNTTLDTQLSYDRTLHQLRYLNKMNNPVNDNSSVASKSAVDVENYLELRNEVGNNSSTLEKLISDGKSSPDLTNKTINSNKNYSTSNLIEIRKKGCEITCNDSLYRNNSNANLFNSHINQNEQEVVSSSCTKLINDSEPTKNVDFVQIKHEPVLVNCYSNPIDDLLIENNDNIAQWHSQYEDEVENERITTPQKIMQMNNTSFTLNHSHSKILNTTENKVIDVVSKNKRKKNKSNLSTNLYSTKNAEGYKTFQKKIYPSDDIYSDKFRTTKKMRKMGSYSYLDKQYNKGAREEIISPKDIEIFQGVNRKEKKKNYQKFQSKISNESKGKKGGIEDLCELNCYPIKMKKKKNKRKVKEMYCADNDNTKEYTKSKEELQIIPCPDEKILNVTIKEKKKRVSSEKLDTLVNSYNTGNYEEKQRNKHDDLPHKSGFEDLFTFDNGSDVKRKKNKKGVRSEMCDISVDNTNNDKQKQIKQHVDFFDSLSSELGELNRQKSGIEDLFEFNNSYPNDNEKKKKKRKIEDVYHEDNITRGYSSCTEEVEVVLDVGTAKKSKKKSHSEKLDVSVASCNTENYGNFGKFNSKKRKKAKEIYGQYENEQQKEAEIISGPNEDILDCKNKTCHKSNIEELEEQKNTIIDLCESSNGYSKEVKKKKKKSNIYHENDSTHENCDGEIQVEIIETTDKSGVLTKKKKKKNHSKNLDVSLDSYSIESEKYKEKRDVNRSCQLSNNSNDVRQKRRKKIKVVSCDDERRDKENPSEEITLEFSIKKKRKNINSDNLEIPKLEEQKSNVEDNIEYSHQVKKKKRKFKDDTTQGYFICGELQDNIATENTDGSKVVKKNKKINSEKLDSLISSCTTENCEETPRKHSKNVLKYSSDELLDSKGQNSIKDECELNSHVTKKKKKLKDIYHEYGIKDECYNDKDAILDRKIENAHTFQATSSPEKSRKLSKFAKHFIIKNGKCEDMAVKVELSWLQDDLSEIPIESLNINIPFPIHPLHMYCTSPSRPKPEEIAAAQEANLKIKSGIFTKAEDNKIRDNWSRFCKEHDLNASPSYFFQFPRMMNMEQKVKFLQYLGHGLEDRLLHRIHYRFKKIFQNPLMKQGRFTTKEDKQILNYLASTESKKPFRDLAQMLNRTNLSIEKRYDFLSSSMKTKIKWSIDLVDKLVNCMLKITKSEDIDSLRNVTFTTKQWLKLSRKMGNISVEKLQRAWKIYIYPRFFSNNYVDLVKMKKKIIKILYKRKETDWRSVNWEEIAAEFDGFTAQKIYMMFKHTVNFNVPEHLSKNLEDCVDYMKNVFLKDSYLHTAHKFDKFIYKDGHVQYESR